MQAKLNLDREIRNSLAFGISAPGAPVSMHFHSQVEIYQVRSGEVEVIVNGNRRVLHAGEISVALSYDAHSYKNLGKTEIFYLIIPTDYCGEFTRLLSGRRAICPFIDDAQTVKTVSEAADKLMRGCNELTERGLIYEILGAVLDKIPQSNEPSSEAQYGFSPEILIYVSEHFREELTLSSVARSFGYNPSYLSRRFREIFGISFIEYLTMIRLREAVLLLSRGKKSITECALDSGFGSMRSFYRAFSDEFGTTPKEYFAEISKTKK